MLISTFELLVKPQLPKDDILDRVPNLPAAVKNKVAQLRRNAIQGYFLTIANPGTQDLVLSLVFTVKNSVDLDRIVPILDITNSDDTFGNLTITPTRLGNKLRFSPLTLAAGDTALFLLQPNFLSFPQLLVDTNFEVRGYVEVFPSSFSPQAINAQIQVTPEHRGTFYNFAASDPDTLSQLDQYAYSLPVQNGGLLRLGFPIPGQIPPL